MYLSAIIILRLLTVFFFFPFFNLLIVKPSDYTSKSSMRKINRIMPLHAHSLQCFRPNSCRFLLVSHFTAKASEINAQNLCKDGEGKLNRRTLFNF